MFLNFFSDLNTTDKVFFAVIIGSLLLVLIWFIIGKILNNMADKKAKEAKNNLENINNEIKDDNESSNNMTEVVKKTDSDSENESSSDELANLENKNEALE